MSLALLSPSLLGARVGFLWKSPNTDSVAANDASQLSEARMHELFDEYQQIWELLGNRWMEFRRTSGTG